MSTILEPAADAARQAFVVADARDNVADLCVDLQALGFVAQRVCPGRLAATLGMPDVALVVGSGASAAAVARRGCIAVRSEPRTAHVPIVVVLPVGHVPPADSALGAHELIVRPLRPGELLSRIDRATGACSAAPPELDLGVGALRLDPHARRVWIAGRPAAAPFSAREFQLLHYLVCHPARVHTRAHLVRTVWDGAGRVRERTVDVQVRRIRAKLGVDLAHSIRTVRSVGYVFDEHAARAAMSP